MMASIDYDSEKLLTELKNSGNSEDDDSESEEDESDSGTIELFNA